MGPQVPLRISITISDIRCVRQSRRVSAAGDAGSGGGWSAARALCGRAGGGRGLRGFRLEVGLDLGLDGRQVDALALELLRELVHALLEREQLLRRAAVLHAAERLDLGTLPAEVGGLL